MDCMVGREITQEFVAELKNGSLQPILSAVLRDDTLCLEIRQGYINLYYRGGSMLRIGDKPNGFLFAFDSRYCEHKTGRSEYSERILCAKTVSDYVELIPFIKAEMDWYFHEHPKLEREIQQQILRENNRGVLAGDTDYYIADIEYANMENGSRFDMLAVKWPSTSPARKNRNGLSLSFIEVKYGDNALTGAAGLKKHFEDIESFLRNHSFSGLCSEAQRMLNQKIELGLINGVNETSEISIDPNKRPEFILLFANHKPASSILKRELEAVVQSDTYISLIESASVKIAASSLMGYGLYERTMYSIEDYIHADCNS
jgi:hypothetical protein